MSCILSKTTRFEDTVLPCSDGCWASCALIWTCAASLPTSTRGHTIVDDRVATGSMLGWWRVFDSYLDQVRVH